MALQEVTASVLRRVRLSERRVNSAWTAQCQRYASSQGGVSQEVNELEATDFQSTPADAADKRLSEYSPLERSRRRRAQLPASRYQFRPPKYFRGALHPHQPPKGSDPASREYIPGPFSLPRLEQTYHDTFKSDLMTLAYTHFPPGTEPHKKGARLREWTGDSPYFKNRPLRGPRGGDVLKLLRKPITFRNVPQLERVTVHTMVKQAAEDSAHLHVAGMVLQAITNVRATAHEIRASVAGFGIRQGQHLSVTCELRGEDMYHFMSKVVDVVMPKIKDWPGVKGSSGDSSGNLAFGLESEQVALFPEIEVNYDAYPPKMIPGLHVVVHTSATNDRDARMLLSSVGIPFYGKLIN
ncbi:Putative ribosomal protein L5 [Septoria linicola]|uniref:Large ribosomal subunit protein uL5m n=1 Tax=Septoria linicola TaxID=215465 RepID=A0A9Q9EIG5_9PEZI|nr:putative ribosomal protein L5 [Septoria linicola]USW51074.1 Putative ribosomal protein L5 [Septoria linicola]